MKTWITIVLLFCSYTQLVSQSGNHVILYEVSTKPIDISKYLSKENNNNKVLTTNLNKLFNSSKKLTFKLVCTPNESGFFMPNKMDIPTSKKNLAELVLGNEYYYTNLKTSTILCKKEALGETFIVSHDMFKWKLTQEEKRIQNYLCKKAIGTKRIINSKGVFKFKIEAWFTPEIPISFAPLDYMGLPGLILELTGTHYYFKAKKIELNTTIHDKIKKPTSGITVSYNEFETLVKNSMQAYKKKYH